MRRDRKWEEIKECRRRSIIINVIIEEVRQEEPRTEIVLYDRYGQGIYLFKRLSCL